MQRSVSALAGLALSTVVLAGCQFSHPVGEVVPDDEMTYDDYDDTVAFGPGDFTPWGVPPVPVHAFSPGDITGGTRVIDGQSWLNANNKKRNDLLLAAQKEVPQGMILVLVVGTGEVWQVPGTAFALDNPKLHIWEEDELSEYYFQAPKTMTQAQFSQLTAVSDLQGIPMPYFIHDLGPIGMQEIKSANGFQVLAAPIWNHMTPAQRSLELIGLDHSLQQLPQFQGQGNAPVFGVSLSWGAVYAVPEHHYDNLIGWHALQSWTAEQIGNLPWVLPAPDHTIRDIKPLDLRIDTKF